MFGTTTATSSLGAGTSAVGLHRLFLGPHAGDDVLLLRDCPEQHRHLARRGPLVHDAGGPAVGDDDGGHRDLPAPPRPSTRRTTPTAAPRRRGSATARPAREPATIRMAPARRASGGACSAAARAPGGRLPAITGPPGDDVLLLRVCLEARSAAAADPEIVHTPSARLRRPRGRDLDRARRRSTARQPRSPSASGWFRYGPNNPGTCNDEFGTRAPVTVALPRCRHRRCPYPVDCGAVLRDDLLLLRHRASTEGTATGGGLSFTTSGSAAAATTAAASVAIGTGDLNGSGIPTGRPPAGSATARPTPGPVTTRSEPASPRRQRHRARRRERRGRVRAGRVRPRDGDDVLLLRHRLERHGHRRRGGERLHHHGLRWRRPWQRPRWRT